MAAICISNYLGPLAAGTTRQRSLGSATARASVGPSWSSRRPSCCRPLESWCSSPGSRVLSSPRCSLSHNRTRRSAQQKHTLLRQGQRRAQQEKIFHTNPCIGTLALYLYTAGLSRILSSMWHLSMLLISSVSYYHSLQYATSFMLSLCSCTDCPIGGSSRQPRVPPWIFCFWGVGGRVVCLLFVGNKLH